MLSPSLREAGSAAGNHSKENNSERIFVVFVFMLVSVFVVVIVLSFLFLVATPRRTIVSVFFVEFVFMFISVFVVVANNFLSSVFLKAPAQHSFFSLYFLQYLDV